MIFLFKIIPQNLLSRLFGCITRIPVPQSLLKRIIQWYSRAYQVQDEYIEPEGGFKSFGDFFIRALRPGSRTIDPDEKAIISPVDARIDQFGSLENNTIIQAKGIHYSVQDLVPSSRAEQFINGSFITLYLSPGDYHRIHAPLSGSVTGYTYVPGRLFTVQDYMVRGLKGLFTRNERLITYIEHGGSEVALCKVGAMNVGRISVSYDSLVTNRTFRTGQEHFYDDPSQKPLKKGDEVGIFNLGSTVILLFPPDFARLDPLKTGSTVKLGQHIGVII